MFYFKKSTFLTSLQTKWTNVGIKYFIEYLSSHHESSYITSNKYHIHIQYWAVLSSTLSSTEYCTSDYFVLVQYLSTEYIEYLGRPYDSQLHHQRSPCCTRAFKVQESQGHRLLSSTFTPFLVVCVHKRRTQVKQHLCKHLCAHLCTHLCSQQRKHCLNYFLLSCLPLRVTLASKGSVHILGKMTTEKTLLCASYVL